VEATTSAPGKIMWIGGYAVLERPNLSYNTGVDKRVWARCNEAQKIAFDMPQFGIKLEARFDGSKIIFDREPTDAEKPVEFVKGVAETCLIYLKAKSKQTKSFELATVSDPAFGFGKAKSGLGSSAAVTAAATGAIMALHGYDVEKDRHLIHKLAQYIHSTVQGKVGSGFDIATACFGGCAYSRYSPSFVQEKGVVESVDADWDYVVQQVPVPRGFETAVANIVGESTSTREMVAKYSEYKKAKPEESKAFIAEVNKANTHAIDAIKKLNEFAKKDAAGYDEALKTLAHPAFEEFVAAFNEARAKTKELGERMGAPNVESDVATDFLNESDKNGAIVSRLPGSGGGDSVAAWCNSKEDKARLEKFWRGYSEIKVELLPLSISSEGLRLEATQAFQDFYDRHGKRQA